MWNKLMCIAGAVIGAMAIGTVAMGQGAADAPAQAVQQARTLAEGDPAPSLEGLTWLKGEPVRAFEPGKYYIVEMWATWCGPCKRGIPHLTEIQAKHKDKLTVLGISCWERKKDPVERVMVARSFVEQQGDAMGYTVAADAAEMIVKNWMLPAGRRSIPTAFVVDGFGNIAWIGNPSAGMDAVLEKVLAGGFDARAEAVKARAAAAVKKVRDERFARANMLAQQGKYEEAMELVDGLLKEETDAGARMGIIRAKMRILLRSDEAGAYVFAGEALEGEFKDNDYGLYQLAESILRTPGLEKPDYGLAVRIMERSVELAAEGNAAVHETLGLARYRAGDVLGAIAAAERALAVMQSAGNKGGEASLARVRAQIEEYRGALGEE